MIVTFAAVTVGIAGALALSAGVTVVLVRLLARLDGAADREPDWWPDFEREFADYVAAQRSDS